MVKHMDHAAYQATLRTKSMAELRFIAKDAREAMDAQPDGPNAGYYADEVHYAAAEIKRRITT